MQLSVFFFKGTVAQWVEHYIIKIDPCKDNGDVNFESASETGLDDFFD